MSANFFEMEHSKEDHKIREALQTRDWPEIKISDSWMVFKIMSEFVDGFQKMGKIGPCVSIFGSARTKENNPYYELAEEIAYKLTQNGFGVITGGGPGIMEAGMVGAGRERSVGVSIRLPFENTANDIIAGDEKHAELKYFFTRKFALTKASQAFICMPGGFGTLDELFDVPHAIYMETNKSWSIDDKRYNFQFGCEVAWEIRHGKRVRMLR